MLGRSIADPEIVEAGGEVDGLGLLDVTTRLTTSKTTQVREAESLEIEPQRCLKVRGYFVHMGRTTGQGVRRCFLLRPRNGVIGRSESGEDEGTDGAVNDNGKIWGTYLHGIFGLSGFRRAWINRIRARKGLTPLPDEISRDISRSLSGQLDTWADHQQLHLKSVPSL